MTSPDLSKYQIDFRYGYEITTRIPDHQILLSFTSDWQATAFIDWFNQEGRLVFQDWISENIERIQDYF